MSLGGATSSRYVFIASLSTPMVVGWYEPLQPDPMGIRASEVKGLWRWWARAFVAGAMYDLGLLEGFSRRDVVLSPSRDDVKRINFVVGKVMGLGYAGDAGSEASRFTIYTEYTGRGSLQPKCSSDGLQRIMLLALKKSVCFYSPGPATRFSIAVEKRRSVDSNAELAAVKILVAVLQLSGVGNGGRRGLGSLDLSLPPELSFRDLRQLISDVYDSTVDIVKRVASREHWNVRRQVAAPPLPVVSRKSFRGMPVTRVLLARARDFQAVHNFFTRSERCRVLAGSPTCDDDLRKTLNAWVLGLPRGRGGAISTGYTLRSISRRASPILVAYHTRVNSLGEGAYISILFSADWPTEVEWYGAGRQRIAIDLNRLCDAYTIAVNELIAYLQRLGIVTSSIWP